MTHIHPPVFNIQSDRRGKYRFVFVESFESSLLTLLQVGVRRGVALSRFRARTYALDIGTMVGTSRLLGKTLQR